MSKYEVVSGKHIILSHNKGRVGFKTYIPGESFEAEPCQVKNIMDKLKKISEKEQRVENKERIDEKIKEKKGDRFSRGKESSVSR